MAAEVWNRFTIHHTPTHGSWLNQAEIEIGIFSRQCLGHRRIPDLDAAIAEPRELGNISRAAEEARAVWSWTWLEHLCRDVQYAFRTMRHNPGFTTTAVLSLALGIGANTAIFSLIDALMLRWLPVRDPQELVQLKMGTGESFSYPIVTALADQQDIFSGVAGLSGSNCGVGPRGSVRRIPGAWVTGGYYGTLGVNPAMGRLITRADDQPGAPLVAVISYGYWERQFARNPGAIGQAIPVNGIPVTIAGVSPPGFVGANVGAILVLLLSPASALYFNLRNQTAQQRTSRRI